MRRGVPQELQGVGEGGLGCQHAQCIAARTGYPTRACASHWVQPQCALQRAQQPKGRLGVCWLVFTMNLP